ncbi:MAG: hypothetical protein RIK87_18585 [Fuerstiella sp.]
MQRTHDVQMLPVPWSQKSLPDNGVSGTNPDQRMRVPAGVIRRM